MRLAVLAALALGSGLLAGCMPGRSLVDYVERRSPSALFSVPTADSLVAFTFDDGPEAGHTDRVLDVLAAHGARATFFLVGERVAAEPALARRIADEGHEVANHGWTRDPAWFMTAAQVGRGIARTDSLLRELGAPVWYRPSVGLYHRGTVRAAEAAGYRLALGSITTMDPQLPWIGMQARHILRLVRPGDVVVLHDGIGRRTKAPEILARVLPELARRGYRVVSLSELAAASEPASGGAATRRE